MTEEDIKALYERLTKFRERCTAHWGVEQGTMKFGFYSPVIAMEMLRNKTDDHIWELTLIASKRAEERAHDTVGLMFKKKPH